MSWNAPGYWRAVREMEAEIRSNFPDGLVFVKFTDPKHAGKLQRVTAYLAAKGITDGTHALAEAEEIIGFLEVQKVENSAVEAHNRYWAEQHGEQRYIAVVGGTKK
jgi:hypothetical protein